jgi:hypothetical protein
MCTIKFEIQSSHFVETANYAFTCTLMWSDIIRDLPHYRQLNYCRALHWLSATAAAPIGTTLAAEKNYVALKSVELLEDELPLVFKWKFRNLGFRVLSSREKTY